MLRNVNVSREVCLLTGVSLTDVDRHKVGQAGEFGSHLAKLTKLGHEGRSGAGAEVDDERSSWPAPAKEGDDLPGGEVAHLGVGGGGTSLCLLQHISHGIGKSFLKLGYEKSGADSRHNLPTLTLARENKYSMSSTDFNFSPNPDVPSCPLSFSLNILNVKSGARALMMFITRKKAKVPGKRRKTARICRHLYGVRCVNCMLKSLRPHLLLCYCCVQCSLYSVFTTTTFM